MENEDSLEVCVLVKEAIDAFKNGRDDTLKWNCLKELEKMLPSNIWTSTQQEFMVQHFARLLTVMLDHLDPKLFSEKWQEDLFDSFFLQGICHEVFMVLCSALAETEPSYKLDKILSLLESLLTNIHIMFKAQCIVGHEEGQWSLNSMLWEQLITISVSLPDKVANKLKTKMKRKLFEPSQYFRIMVEAELSAMYYVHERLSAGRDSSLEFLSRFLGRTCALGHADVCLDFLVPILVQLCSKDYIWQRICHRVFVKGQDRCLEAVITPLIRKLKWYKQMEWFLADTVLTSEKLKFLLTTKLLLIRFFEEDLILQNIIGYLAQSESRQPLFFEVFVNVLDAWGSSSAIKHQPYQQHFYLTRCLIICVAHLKLFNFKNHRIQLLQSLLQGVHTHLSNSQPSVRTMGMVVAENLSSVLDSQGSKLKFEYEKTTEVEHLLSLMEIPSEPDVNGGVRCTESSSTTAPALSDSESDTENNGNSPNVVSVDNQQLDSDDDLEPFDMSHDVPLEKQNFPRYVRDCLQGLTEQDKPEWTQACLREAEKLIRQSAHALKEIGVDMAKTLLHMEDTYSTANYVALRHKALIATVVQSPKEVAEYLTSQFYDRNYSIRQRIDILEVLAAASQELSSVKGSGGEVAAAAALPDASLTNVESADTQVTLTEHWKDVVEKRIESKTRRFAQGPKHPEPQPQNNNFSSVAGYFFFPLMHHYDRKENTFDLLGEDHYLLGRLIYTLAVIMHSAANTPVARHMGASLLNFIWCFRYHTEVFVRQALIYALCMVLIDIPSHILLTDFQGDVYECQLWLEDIMEKDPDTECQKRARQVLGVLAGVIKKELADS